VSVPDAQTVLVWQFEPERKDVNFVVVADGQEVVPKARYVGPFAMKARREYAAPSHMVGMISGWWSPTAKTSFPGPGSRALAAIGRLECAAPSHMECIVSGD
jgi:hypothetical protein